MLKSFTGKSLRAHANLNCKETRNTRPMIFVCYKVNIILSRLLMQIEMRESFLWNKNAYLKHAVCKPRVTLLAAAVRRPRC